MRMLALLSVLLASCAPNRPSIAIRGATLVDGSGGAAVPDSLVVVEGNRITAAGPAATTSAAAGAQVVEAVGKFVIPGLMDLHVHLGSTGGPQFRAADYTRERILQNLNAYLYLGVTTVRSVGTEREAGLAIRELQRAGTVATSRLFTAGRGFTAPGGHPSQEIGDIARQPPNPEDARRQVRELAAQRVDLIKIWIDPRRGQAPKVSDPVVEAILAEAAQHKIPVHAHIHSLADTRHFLDHGGAGLLHMVRDTEVLPADFVESLRSRKTAFVPTLVRQELAWLYREKPERLDDPDAAPLFGAATIAAMRESAGKSPQPPKIARDEFDLAMRNSKRLADKGVVIAVGSDGGSQMDLPGLMTHRECELLVEAGFTPAQALVAATANGARALAMGDIGTVAAGKLADLVLLDADPLASVGNLRKIHRVMLDGKWVDRSGLLPP